MRLKLLIFVLLSTTTGCQGMRFGRLAAVCKGENGSPAATCATDTTAAGSVPCAPGCNTPCAPTKSVPCPPPCQPTPPVKEVKAPPPQVRAPQVREEIETRTATTAVTQDILLIPRTVYVPYAPHVPVAPARLVTTAPAAQVVHTEERVREQVAAPAPVQAPVQTNEAQINHALDQCLQQMRALNERIAGLESRAACAAPAPCPAPVPAPVFVAPPRRAVPAPDCVPSSVPSQQFPVNALPMPRVGAQSTTGSPNPGPIIQPTTAVSNPGPIIQPTTWPGNN